MQESERVQFVEKKVFLEDGIGFVELLEVMGSDLTVVNAARVSFNKESQFEVVVDGEGGSVVECGLAERDKKLIHFLAEHDHNSPFFHPILRFRIKMPIFTAREWWRHTIGFARNEVSRRYVTYEPECFLPKKFRKRDKNVKQGSKDEAVDRNDRVHQRVQDFCVQAVALYNDLMNTEDVCPEQARIVLPQAMYTEFIETASLAGYARLFALRSSETTQQETKAYALGIGGFIEQKFPVSWKALVQHLNKSSPLP